MSSNCDNLTEQALCLDAPINTTTAKWQLLPEKDENVIYEARYGVEITPLINGQEAFTALEQAILKATNTVDIICWGFDPSLRLSGPNGKYRFGELLEKKAEEGVEVRVLIWYSHTADWFFGFKDESLPDYDRLSGNYDNGVGKYFRQIDHNFREESVVSKHEAKLENAFKRYQEAAKKWRDSPNDQTRALMEDKHQAFETLYNQAYTEHDGTPYLQWEDRIYNEAWYRKYANSWLRNSKLWFTTRAIKNFSSVMDMTEGSEDSFEGFFQKQLGKYFATHHQKMVLIDYLKPKVALGFVMGHNMQKNYFDDDKHHFEPKNRYKGFRPWQDISTRVRGPVLVDLNHNFSRAWDKEIPWDKWANKGSNIGSSRDNVTKEAFISNNWEPKQLDSRSTFKCNMAQIIRTEHVDQDKSILRSYENSLNNVTDYVYSENQYFRYKPFADQLIELAAKRKAKGAKDLYWFVVTNKPNSDGEGVNTYKMFKALGHHERLPRLQLNELKTIKEMEDEIRWFQQEQNAFFSGTPSYENYERAIKITESALTELKEKHPETAKLREKEREKEVVDELDVDNPQQAFELQNNDGLNVHIATLESCTRNQPKGYPTLYTPIYVHSKLLLVDDVYFLLGSCNINKRSMELDTELAIATPTPALAKHARNHLWGEHADKVKGSSFLNYQYWQDLMDDNWARRYRGEPLMGFLIHFYDPDCEVAAPND
ncbi:phospholipase D-like domain-containing protein [Neptuniibacter sp. QD72_48]|uniref:phospholipase D-like domain-containing protein n=1 Tax=Neptuniibacter sp. QD72_48 TaxID=3398214 RepID=UPI0039F4CFE2